MRYADWEQGTAEALRRDPLWQRAEYRLALYIADVGWDDLRALAAGRLAAPPADQLRHALGALPRDIADAARQDDRGAAARRYEAAIGWAMEGRAWYARAGRALGPRVARQRARVLTSIARQLAAAAAPGAGPRTAR